jgi:hypothetical protein
MSAGTVRQNIIILLWKYQFNFWEYINGNQTFILDSHRPVICSASDEGQGGELGSLLLFNPLWFHPSYVVYSEP